MLVRLAICLIVALTLAALAGTPAPAERSASGDRVLVDYRRLGGLAGRSDHLVLRRDGHAWLRTGSGSRRVLVGERTRSRLVRALRRARFAQLKPSYAPPHPVADALTHTIAYRRHTVRAVDTAIPPRLRPVIEILDRIVDGRS